MSIRAQNNFDGVDCAVGTIAPGWANVDGTWAVGTTNPISGARSFGSTSKGSLDTTIFANTGAGAPIATAAMGVQFDQKITSVASASPTIGPIFRSDAAGQNFYLLVLDFSAGTSVPLVFLFKRIAGSYIQITSATSGLTMAVNDVLHWRTEISGTSISVYLWLNGASRPGTPTTTFTDSSITAAGYPGLIYSTAGIATPSMGADNFVLDDTTAATPMVAGTATAGGTSGTTAAATATAPTGGSGTYVYQWFRSTTNGSLGAAVSGQTATTLADSGLSASTTYYYALKQTDANGDFVYTNQIVETTSAGSSATAYSLTGPATGTAGVPSSNFTVTPNGPPSTSLVVTPSATGCTFSPASLTFSTSAPQTFTCTAATAGAKTISVTHTGGGFVGDPANLTYTAAAALKYNQVNATDTRTGQNVMVLVPNSNAAIPYNAANPTGIILYSHGAGEDQTALLSDSLKLACVNALLDAGYILAGTNAHGDNWGNQVSVDDYCGLDEYVRANYNVSNVCIWSQSMGGMDGLLVLAQNKVQGVVGWLGTYPVCNLANLYGLGTYTGSINTAYGITGAGIQTYAHQTRGNDPSLGFGGLAFRNVPMRFYASPSDTVVPKANNTDPFKAFVQSSTRESVVVVCSGNHGDPSHFQPTDYVSFFQRCFATPVATTGIAGVSAGATFPTAAQVLTGITFGPTSNLTGTIVQPTAAQVQSGITFGPSSSLTGTISLPTAAQVLLGITFGAGSSLTGTVSQPTAAQVQSGITFGPSNSLTGTYTGSGGGTFPTTSQVLTGIVFGPTANLTGNVTQPVVSQVQSGVTFGPSNSLTGTYASAGIVPRIGGSLFIRKAA